MKLTLDDAVQKGIAAHQAGHIEEAESFYSAILKTRPRHSDANHNMGVLLVGVGKVQDALPFFKTALEAKPSVAQFWLSYIDALMKVDRIADAQSVLDQAKGKGAKGEAFDQLERQLSEPHANPHDPPERLLQHIINLFSQGHLQQALSETTQILDRFPNSAVLYNMAGVSSAGLMKFDAAINSYKQALKINPEFADGYYNMGVVLQNKGDLEEALGNYKQALKIRPDYAEAYNNMGVVLQNRGDLESAIDSYKQALKIKPDYAESYNNMGNALKYNGDLESAIESYSMALRIKPDIAEVHSNMGDALKGITFTKPNVGLQAIIISILDKKICVRPSDIVKGAINLLKFEPSIKELFKKHSIGKLKQSLERLISNLSEVPLLFRLMSVCPIPDLDLEMVLKDMRSALLLSVSETSNSPEVLHFQSVLALQCFTNEYLYNQSDNDTKALVTLETLVEQTILRGEQPTPQSILCLATYKALHEYKWCDLLIVSTSIEEVFTRQVLEPKREGQLKADISALQGVTEKVSLKVREMYEESPYPRWVNLGLPLNSAPISNVTKKIKLRLFNKTINVIEAPNILVAGCGTGQHSIETASRFKDAKVLAVDLSFSSLAYAKRKTKELGLENIDYIQADILDLRKLDKKFDIIESVGVLHHMNDPMAGWRVLTDCLKSGGLMNIGLYSELARQHIVKMREEINQSGIGSSDLAIKSFRNNVIKSEKDHHKQILPSDDFYSLSTLRDLLFHVQEHRFTIPQIQESLDELGLKFCGFESSRIVYNFKLVYTKPDDPYDLDKWNAYEEANPRCFAGMYQFWCQKVV